MIIAIDGPAGAGKSSVSQQAARRLGFQLLDTGAIYRSVALMASRQGIGWNEADALAAVARRLSMRFELEGEVNKVYAGLRDKEGEPAALEEVTGLIRCAPRCWSCSARSARPATAWWRGATSARWSSLGRS